jgi:hypothetical protein
MAHYSPPKQSKVSQLFDVIVLIAMTFGALYTPIYMGLAGGAKVDADPAKLTWDGLGENAVQVAQYNALGITDPSTVPGIFARYDYSFSLVALVSMVVIIVAYYALMLKFSETEYREVIAEKFDK